MALLFTLPRSVQTDAIGQLMSGWTVEFYATGTSAPKTVYADVGLTIPLGTSAQADDDGTLQPIYLDDLAGALKILIKDANGELVPNGTIDPYLVGPTQAQIVSVLNPRTTAEQSAGVTPASLAYTAGYLQRYGGVGNGTTVSTTALTNAALQAAQAGGVAVKVSGGTYRVDSNTTIPAGLTLDFTEGGALTIDNGITLTINCRIVASPGQQIFAGTGSVVFGLRSTPEVYPDWWGSEINAVRKALTATTGKYITVRLGNGGTYQFDAQSSVGLALVADGDSIIGPGRGNATSGEVYSGAVLEYTGTSGTAILCGIAPGTNGNFMEGLELSGFTLKVTENTDIAMRLWHVSQSYIHDLTIRGNSDNDTSDNVGLQIDGCVDLDVARVLVFGDGTLASGTTKLQNGIKVSNGFSGSNTTTTRLRQVYASQCRIGAQVNDDSFVAFDHCVFESCYDAGILLLNARVRLFDPWFEDNGASGNPPIRVQGAASSLVMDAGVVNIGANQYFIGVEANAQLSLLGGTRFASSHGSPRIFSLGGNQPAIAIIGENTYATSTTESDTSASKLVKLLDGNLTVRSLLLTEHTPSSAADTGVADRVTRDDDYLYVCTATNTWKRVAIATW